MPEEQKRNNGAESRVWGVISQLGLNKVIFLLTFLLLRHTHTLANLKFPDLDEFVACQ